MLGQLDDEAKQNLKMNTNLMIINKKKILQDDYKEYKLKAGAVKKNEIFNIILILTNQSHFFKS